MWTTENRSRYDRSKLRYPSDLTDDEWFLVRPLIPGAKRGGNKRTVDVCEVVNGIMYILGTGCQWAALPKDLPPCSTVNSYFLRWEHDRTLDRLHHALYVQCREQPGGGPARVRRSSTAGASGARNKGAFGPTCTAEPVLGSAFGRIRGMPGRRSRARSGTSWSIPRAC